MKKSDSTKTHILNTALPLIKANGYDKVRITDITKAAGVSESTFYYYFPNKLKLMIAFFDADQMINAEDLNLILLQRTAWEQLWTAHCVYAQKMETLGKDVVRIVYSNKDILGIIRTEHRSIMYPLIARAQAEGVIQNTAPLDDLYRTVNSLMLGIYTEWSLSGDDFDLKETLRQKLGVLYCLNSAVCD